MNVSNDVRNEINRRDSPDEAPWADDGPASA